MGAARADADETVALIEKVKADPTQLKRECMKRSARGHQATTISPTDNPDAWLHRASQGSANPDLLKSGRRHTNLTLQIAMLIRASDSLLYSNWIHSLHVQPAVKSSPVQPYDAKHRGPRSARRGNKKEHLLQV